MNVRALERGALWFLELQFDSSDRVQLMDSENRGVLILTRCDFLKILSETLSFLPATARSLKWLALYDVMRGVNLFKGSCEKGYGEELEISISIEGGISVGGDRRVVCVTFPYIYFALTLFHDLLAHPQIEISYLPEGSAEMFQGRWNIALDELKKFE